MINKIFNYFGFDGLKHIICSNLLVSLLQLILPLWIAIIITVVIGIGKELIYDKLMKKGTCDKKDIISNLIGIIIGCLP